MNLVDPESRQAFSIVQNSANFLGLAQTGAYSCARQATQQFFERLPGYSIAQR